ncbi:MAG: hypothetical protein Q7S17_09105 [Xanthobacteraceae bacterium]|nr:hypothetical protein [Xanthobacteraceae bacterium]
MDFRGTAARRFHPIVLLERIVDGEIFYGGAARVGRGGNDRGGLADRSRVHVRGKDQRNGDGAKDVKNHTTRMHLMALSQGFLSRNFPAGKAWRFPLLARNGPSTNWFIACNAT